MPAQRSPATAHADEPIYTCDDERNVAIALLPMPQIYVAAAWSEGRRPLVPDGFRPRQREHPVQRDPGPVRRVGVDLDPVDHSVGDQVLHRPDQMRKVDPVHGRAEADRLVEEDHGLVGMLLGKPVDQVELCPDGP